MRWACIVILVAAFSAGSRRALAGPPYVTDDPEPTEYHHYEVYLFGAGTSAHDGTAGAAGIDFNYGAAPDLQLTVVLPSGFDHPLGDATTVGLGRIELAAKIRVLHRESSNWDLAFFPRVFLPAGSPALGERHTSVLLPLWLGRSWNRWSTFGGGGCVLNRGEGSRDFCLMSWALTRKVTPRLALGGELTHASADTRGGLATTAVGAGVAYDLSARWHLLGSLGSGVHNASETNRFSCYAALLFTY